jgi:Sucrase/ferredoxin-like
LAEAAPLCSAVSRASSEPLYGTASRVRGWLLLEQPGPWGPEAPLQSRLDPVLGAALQARAEAARVRLLLLRRPGRSPAGPPRCFVAHSGRRRRWVEERQLDDPADLLGLNLDGVRVGRRPGFGALARQPLHLVCTNGRHDRCCATWGRPLAAALAASHRAGVWECSHIGGDRFAGNLVCLPHGLYFGRVGPQEGPRVAAAYERGLVDLDHYRGRSCDPPVVQAADWFARRELDLLGVDDLAVLGLRPEPDGLMAVGFASPAGRVELRLRVASAAPRLLTCNSRRALAPPAYTLVGLDRAPAA